MSLSPEFKKNVLLFTMFFIVILFPCTPCTAQEKNLSEKNNESSCEEEKIFSLLREYLSNDRELKTLTIKAEESSLSLQEEKINQGISVSLSSGTMTFNKAGGVTEFSLKPNVSVGLPGNKTSITVSSNPVIETGGSSGTETKLNNTGINLSTELISNTKLTQKISLMKKQRSLLEAERAVKQRAVSAEKEFYTELKNLLNEAKNVLTERQTLYEKELNLKTVIAQGYETNSANYRNAEFSVRSANRKLEETKREYVHLQNSFVLKCNDEKELYSTFEEAWKFLPQCIPSVVPLEFSSFNKEKYSEIENALWNKEIGSLERTQEKHFTLSANAGYTFNNTFGEEKNSGSSRKENTVDTGLGLDWNGFTADAKVNVPVEMFFGNQNEVPSFSLSFGYRPNVARINKITEQEKLLAQKKEELSLESAYESYEKNSVSYKTELDDLFWAKETYAQDLQSNIESEKNMAQWFAKGVISESDYIPEVVNRDKAEIDCLVNAVDFIIYNDEVKLFFFED